MLFRSQMIVMAYPEFQVSDQVYLDEFEVEELTKYKVLYLSGFRYHDKESAELLLKKVSDSGTRVVIDMTYIPEDPITKRNSLLGVTAQNITFINKYSNLMYNGNEYEMDYFDKDYRRWKCSFVEGGEEIIGTTEFMNQTIPFLTTKADGNIVFMGLNLLYHTLLTEDVQGYRILNDVFGIKKGTLPNRVVSPIQVTYGMNEIKIISDIVPINTTIAYQDNFVSDDNIICDNNQLVVTQKETYIKIVYPNLGIGLIMSIIGVILTVVLYRYIKRRD